MNATTLLIRLVVPGPPATGNPRSGSSGRRAVYRRRVEAAVRGLLVARVVPDGPLGVRINVVMRRGRRGDVDNIAKPTLDSLREILGEDVHGRTDDDRVWALLVTKTFEEEGPESVTIEIHALADSTLPVY